VNEVVVLIVNILTLVVIPIPTLDFAVTALIDVSLNAVVTEAIPLEVLTVIIVSP
jgi:hypothetical protein